MLNKKTLLNKILFFLILSGTGGCWTNNNMKIEEHVQKEYILLEKSFDYKGVYGRVENLNKEYQYIIEKGEKPYNLKRDIPVELSRIVEDLDKCYGFKFKNYSMNVRAVDDELIIDFLDGDNYGDYWKIVVRIKPDYQAIMTQESLVTHKIKKREFLIRD